MARARGPDESRRDVLRSLGVFAGAAASLVLPSESAAAAPTIAVPGKLPRRALGKTGVEVSILALGGYHLGVLKDEDEAKRVVHASIDAGMTFFDNAWEYHDGKSEEWLGKALVGKRQQAFVMTKVCTHGRGRAEAMKQLEQSLKRLRTDHLDLWQVHEVIYDDDPDRHYATEGVLEGVALAKKQGKARFVGFTGHKDPSLLLAMIDKGFPFDTLQMPLNVFDASFRSFEQKVLPRARERGLGVLGMKALSGGGEAVKAGVISPEEALRYTLSLPVASVVSGIDSVHVLEQNLRIARELKPMTKEEMTSLRERMRKHARDGRYELYKSTTGYDGKPGREQHGLGGAEE
ncbi:MAG: aldo/keto reductase [Deltaproteobacteria bacterium]|nr:aldo/keto reductase [Deltaproteobacteria bacterium]